MVSAVKKPRIVAFEVTRRCKMNCVHCRASADADFQNDLTTEQCKKIIKSIADYNKCVLIFTGGEPFERTDLFNLIDFASEDGLAVSVATCGYDFDQTKAKRLKKAGVLTLSFSLDSDNAEEHDNFRQTAGAFEKTLAAINIAQKTGLKFQINTTVTKLNTDRLPELAKLAEGLGAYCFNPFMLVPTGRGRELSDIALTNKEYEKTLKTVAQLKANSSIEARFTCAPRFAAVFREMYPESKKKAFGCLAATDFAFVSHAGDVQTCGFLKIPAGNILQAGDFGSIWEKSDFLNSIRQKKFSGKCGVCNFVTICGGCRARAFAGTGDCLFSDPLCSYISSVSSLIAAHIEEDKLDAVSQAINILPNVSHNYLRNHYYNLWFTLRDSDSGRIDKSIKELSEKFETDFLSFPATKRYKLDSTAVRHHSPPDVFNALFCCKVNGAASQSAIRFLCDLPQVSHCIQRKTLPHWPYNLYAMLHEQESERIEEIVTEFVGKFEVKQFQTLPTIKSLK
jgi:radical SAM protein with 4Fe4S-binding SPASM domain